MERRISIIGYGAIGKDLCDRLLDLGFQVTVLLAPDVLPPAQVSGDLQFVHTVSEWLKPRPDLVIEAAGQAALIQIAPAVIAEGIDLLAASVGVAGNAPFMDSISQLSQKTSARLIFPTGAVGGIDYLEVVAAAKDLTVTYTSRKPVAAWSAELAEMGHDTTTLRDEIVLFEGDAVEAARRYPRNLNAGLTIALATGIERTSVRVIADPSVKLNTHEINVQSAFGDAYMRFANLPSPHNPKTSAITAESLVAAVRSCMKTRPMNT
ncbi:aspartate dehydrogenase [Pararhizobium sp. YC-54]|uniref:aspartate dehydrogenase n=1 Tax=Pararhizobium sp. YC-54 TaxID=2986920 RepID=UPI0021F7C1B7|nr:aspartate dehydrogenase [Pararhizobium sp. YC-54]MCW0001497.1 aspartate dehydrogenase [Pararhizobium sp. YC-54]